MGCQHERLACIKSKRYSSRELRTDVKRSDNKMNVTETGLNEHSDKVN